jgi:hypothetical protein
MSFLAILRDRCGWWPGRKETGRFPGKQQHRVSFGDHRNVQQNSRVAHTISHPSPAPRVQSQATCVRRTLQSQRECAGNGPESRAGPRVIARRHTYIANNAGAIPDYAERWRYGERVATSFVESTVNLVVGKRFAKRQQMQWSPRGAHLLLQTRTGTLDGTLRATFARWYPGLAANDQDGSTLAAAA